MERRAPATVPLPRRHISGGSRYFLRDPYLRFHYRFVDPNLDLIEQGLTRRLWESVQDNFRAFVADAFEDLCRAWTRWLRPERCAGIAAVPADGMPSPTR